MPHGSCKELVSQLQQKIFDLSSRLNDVMPSADFVGDSQPSSSVNSHFLSCGGGGEDIGSVRGMGTGGGGLGRARGRRSTDRGGRVGYRRNGGQERFGRPDGFQFGGGSRSGSRGDGVSGGGGGSRSAIIMVGCRIHRVVVACRNNQIPATGSPP